MTEGRRRRSPRTDDDRPVTIAGGPIHLELLPEIGARLHRLRVFGHDLLRTPDDRAEHAREPFLWGAYIMAPWCNRIAAGPAEVNGQVVRLTPNFPDGTAIHGQVYQSPWHMQTDRTLSVRGQGACWPWPYEAMLHVTIEGSRLLIDLSLKNLADTTMPAGLGLHPWFRRPLDVRIDAGSFLPSNTDPRAQFRPVAGPFDMRALRPMPDDLDATWFPDGRRGVELRWPDLGVSALLSARSEAGLFIVAASPSQLDAAAIEPQTHAPHGLRRFLDGEPGGLYPLAPGGTMRLAIELAFARS